jgi:hypothetical protein
LCWLFSRTYSLKLRRAGSPKLKYRIWNLEFREEKIIIN